MSKREKIIVAVMLATVLVGGYMYFGDPQGPGRLIQPEDQAKDLDQFVMQVVNDLTKTDRTTLDGFIITKALESWDRDPFSSRPVKTAPTASALAPEEAAGATAEPVFTPPQLNYSGYLRIGSLQVAIINGEGYAVGEKIEPEGAVLLNILPTGAEILLGQGNVKTVLPLQQPQ